MGENYRTLTETIKGRINPENLLFNQRFRKELGSIAYDDVLVFIRYAMKAVEPEYTQKSIDAGGRVKDHLTGGGLTYVDYRFQGSVMTNTHIRGYSDIDLLCLSSKFTTLARNEVNKYALAPNAIELVGLNGLRRLNETIENFIPYEGDSLNDLRTIRNSSENILSKVYSVYDFTKPKSIKITNTSLRRDVDVVTANWYDDVRAIIYDGEINRGVEVYNKHLHSKESPDFPFISIDKINSRSKDTVGRLKKMIRFLKNLRELSKLEIDLSSYDINAICYDIEVSKYQNSTFIELVSVLYEQLKSLVTSQEHLDRIKSVDEREFIFKNKTNKVENLRLLLNEIYQISKDLHKQLV